MLCRLRARLAEPAGFTLIELLVVVMIVGILAAIAIPSFYSQKVKGEDAQAKSDARTAATAIETYRLDNDTYDADVAGLQKVEKSLRGSRLSSVTGDEKTFEITATSKSGTSFSFLGRTNGDDVRTCAPRGAGGCPDDGRW